MTITKELTEIINQLHITDHGNEKIVQWDWLFDVMIDIMPIEAIFLSK